VNQNLAETLLNAESTEAFLCAAPVSVNTKTISEFKEHLDELIGSDLKKAELLSERITEVASFLGDQTSRAFAEASRARVFHHLGRYEEADALYRSAIDATKAKDLFFDAAVFQMHRVFCLTQMGRFNEALQLSKASRRVLSQHQTVHLAQLETNVGILYYRQDRYSRSIEHFERARTLLIEVPDLTLKAVVDTNLAHALMEVDRHEEALRLLENSATVLESAGRELWAAQTRFHIGYLQFLRGD
jgi:tetratricopeptide (TPR) repeat protein